MSIKKVFLSLVFLIYCFSSSIFSHNTAMHHEEESHHSEVQSHEDPCCDESGSDNELGCFKKCFGEYTKIFTTKIILHQFKNLLLAQYVYNSSSNKDIYTTQKIYSYINASTAPPNIFLSHYLGVVKQTLYA